MRETWVQSLGREDPLEEEMATHSSILAWNPMDGGAWWATVHRVTKRQTQLSDFTFYGNVSWFQIWSRLLKSRRSMTVLSTSYINLKMFLLKCLSSVQFSHSVMSDSLWPHESQHARPPYPSPTPGVHPNSCALSRWCHPAISSSVIPFSSCPQSLPASESFPMSQLFAWGGQSIGVSTLASFLPMNTQDFTFLSFVVIWGPQSRIQICVI